MADGIWCSVHLETGSSRYVNRQGTVVKSKSALRTNPTIPHETTIWHIICNFCLLASFLACQKQLSSFKSTWHARKMESLYNLLSMCCTCGLRDHLLLFYMIVFFVIFIYLFILNTGLFIPINPRFQKNKLHANYCTQ